MGKSGLQLSVLSYGSWVTFHKQLDDSKAEEPGDHEEIDSIMDTRPQLLEH